jgi:hypothetical protein
MYSPYKVLQRTGSITYKLELSPSSHVHRVFLVSCLKKVTRDKITIQTILRKNNKEGKIILERETILETRIK